VIRRARRGKRCSSCGARIAPGARYVLRDAWYWSHWPSCPEMVLDEEEEG